ncbi:MAG TPA: acyl-CoA dehydrogenase family protein [Acidimicrobiia bacterium]|nr:acyl-CoA dehydrogenase family protein [Acidimicrobiia bacterium]
MDFTLSPDQELLRDTARQLLVRECPTTLLRAHIEDPAAADPLWRHLRDFAALGDGPLTDLCVFLEETGYVAAPGPFFPTVALFAPVVAAAGHELLAAALAGEITGTVAVAGADGICTANDDRVKTFVPEADRVDWVAVVSAGPAVTLVQSPHTRSVATVDFSRRFFEVDAGSGSGPAQSIDPEAFESVLERGTIALAAEMVGTARRLFDMTLAYAKERVQFDVPIGSFQALQHKLADMALDLERATSAVAYSAMAVDAKDADRHRAAHVAKAAAGAAATRAAKDGIQIHGGIGYTWEHDLHLFIRHAYGSEAWMGTGAWHHDRLADLLF